MIEISNKEMRQLWLNANGLAVIPTGPLDVMQIIKQLGFVQLDTIQNVSRAHHHILWSRNQNYREHMLDEILAEKGNIFEHFTHDASVIPVEFYPMWTRQFSRMKAYYDKSKRYQDIMKHADLDDILTRIENEGALSTEAFNTKRADKDKMWSRPPHKLALDYMWYAGELATCHRVGFTKYYDLSERIFPDDWKANCLDREGLQRNQRSQNGRDGRPGDHNRSKPAAEHRLRRAAPQPRGGNAPAPCVCARGCPGLQGPRSTQYCRGEAERRGKAQHSGQFRV